MVSDKIVAILLLLVAIAAAQSGFDGFFGRSFGPMPGPANGPQSTGPVLFPSAPNSPETSGVVVGASGYGFVPPGSQGVGRALPRPPSKSFRHFFWDTCASLLTSITGHVDEGTSFPMVIITTTIWMSNIMGRARRSRFNEVTSLLIEENCFHRLLRSSPGLHGWIWSFVYQFQWSVMKEANTCYVIYLCLLSSQKTLNHIDAVTNNMEISTTYLFSCQHQELVWNISSAKLTYLLS